MVRWDTVLAVFMKKILLSGFLAGMVLTGLALRYYALPAYRHHKETRLARQTREFMAKKDYPNASITVRQIRRLNPDNLEALRAGAELAELAHSPQALDLRRRIADLQPTVENKVMLISTALRAQGKPYPLASQIVEELRQLGTTDAVYHAVSAELALRQNKSDEAIREYEAASRAEPTNQLHPLNLAVLRLRSTNQIEAAQARRSLERLSAEPAVASYALRWLITDSLERNEAAAAKEFSKHLLTQSGAMDDRLLHLSILDKAGDPDLGPFLANLQKTTATNASDIYHVCRWMAGHGRADDALKWLTNCPAKVRAEQPAPLAMVDCLVAKKDWPGLEKFLQEQKWGDREFLRLAFLSRTAAEQKQNLGVEARWR